MLLPTTRAYLYKIRDIPYTLQVRTSNRVDSCLASSSVSGQEDDTIEMYRWKRRDIELGNKFEHLNWTRDSRLAMYAPIECPLYVLHLDSTSSYSDRAGQLFASWFDRLAMVHWITTWQRIGSEVCGIRSMQILPLRFDHEYQPSYSFRRLYSQSVAISVLRKQDTNMEKEDSVNTRVELYAWICIACCFCQAAIGVLLRKSGVRPLT